MIDEKKLLEKLDAWYESLSPRMDIQDSIKCDVIDNVMTMIEDAEKVDEWIPVSKRLPEDGELCIVSAAKNSIVMTCPYSEINFKQYGVTAWQPLPEPYREKKR